MRVGPIARYLSYSFFALNLLPSFASAGIEDESNPSNGEAIYMGEECETCAWPSVASVHNGAATCTGTLVHPRLVVYAAHCGGNENTTIGFGEGPHSGVRVNPDLCMTNPDWNATVGSLSEGEDWAFCRLPTPVDLPITPVLAGNCERNVLQEGSDVAIVGFGNNEAETGSGRKRWAITTVSAVETRRNIAIVGSGGQPGPCAGDSGGPAFIRHPDGSWRAFGITSTNNNGCGGGHGTYALMLGALPWIEENSGIDLTPCFDSSGEWDPGPQCRNFFSADAGEANGEWRSTPWCEDSEVIAWPDYCGDDFISDDNEAPTVEITSPASGTEYDEATALKIEIDAKDDLGIHSVKLIVNGEAVANAIDRDEPYGFDMATFPEGQYIITAIARDWADNEVESKPIAVGIGEAAPEIEEPEEEEEGGTSSGDEEDEEESKDSDASADEEAEADSDGESGGCSLSPSKQPLPPAWMAMLLLAIPLRRRFG